MTRKKLADCKYNDYYWEKQEKTQFFSYAQHQGRRIRHYGLTVLICFSVAPDYAIREILPDGLCPSGAAAGPLALDYCLAGISTPHSPPRPACPLGVRCPQTEASEPWAWGCMQGMSARDVAMGDASRGYQQGMWPWVCHLPMVFCPLCIRRPRADCPTRCPAAL